MFRIFCLLGLFTFTLASAQRNISLDSLVAENITEIFVDDYSNLYLYKKNDFTFTKFDSLGTQQAKIHLSGPFKVQDTQNPLRIILFSENRQEVKFLDKNLTDTEDALKLSGIFNFVRAFYSEDREYSWLIEESEKKLIAYNFREDKIISSFPLEFDTDNVVDFLVYRQQAFILKKDQLIILDLVKSRFQNINIREGRKLRRENSRLLVLTRTQILELENNKLKIRFMKPNAKIVDKNHSHYLALIGNKFYLYPAEN